MAETVVMTLTEFLLARIAEGEAVARRAMEHPDEFLDTGPSWYCDEQSDHVAVAPARVLAECEAKWRIVDMYQSREAQAHEHTAIAAHATGLLLALRALASVYADHPDYDEAWRP